MNKRLIFVIVFIMAISQVPAKSKTGILISLPMNESFFKFGENMEQIKDLNFKESQIKILLSMWNSLEMGFYYQALSVDNIRTEKYLMNIDDKFLGVEFGKLFSVRISKLGKGEISGEVSVGLYASMKINGDDEILETYIEEEEVFEDNENSKFQSGWYGTARIRADINKVGIIAGLQIYNPFIDRSFDKDISYSRFTVKYILGVLIAL